MTRPQIDTGPSCVIQLATLNGAPVRLYDHCAGEVIAQDGRRVDFADLPTLIEAHAAQALQLMAHGRPQTAERFKREALDLFDAFEQAKRWRSASQPTNLERAR